MTEKSWTTLDTNVFGIHQGKETPVSPLPSFTRSAGRAIRCPLTYTASEMAPDTFRYQDRRPLFTSHKNKAKGYGAYLVWEISETRASLVFLFLQTPTGEYPLGASQPGSPMSRAEKYAFDILHFDFPSVKTIMKQGLDTLSKDITGNDEQLAKVRTRIDNLTMKDCTADIYLPKNCAPHVGERLYRPGYPFNLSFNNPMQETDVPMSRYARQGLREIAKIEADREKRRSLRAKLRAAAAKTEDETPPPHARSAKPAATAAGRTAKTPVAKKAAQRRNAGPA